MSVDTEIELKTLDTHTAGMPTRILLQGSKWVPDSFTTVLEARDAFKNEYDWIRRLLMQEPRGHSAMYGAVVLPPVEPDSDLSVFFLHGDGYVDACIHGTIGIITALVETDHLNPKSEFQIDTPTGRFRASTTISEDAVIDVQVTNVRSFVFKYLDVAVTTDDESIELEVPLVFAGNLFGLVDIRDLGLDISATSVEGLIELTAQIQTKLNQQLAVMAEEIPGDVVDHIEFYDESKTPPQNVTVFGDGIIDRSPCGTGTCAKMAYLASKGDLSSGDLYQYKSRIGTTFTGTIVKDYGQTDQSGILPAVHGSAYLTGKHTFYYNPHDPLIGFSLV